MSNKKEIIKAIKFVGFVALIELMFFYIVDFYPSFADYAMFVSLAIYFGIAWMLKPKIITLIFAAIFLMLYGVISFFVSYPIYHVGYPLTFQEFLPTIGIKTLFDTLPIVFALALFKK